MYKENAITFGISLVYLEKYVPILIRLHKHHDNKNKRTFKGYIGGWAFFNTNINFLTNALYGIHTIYNLSCHIQDILGLFLLV